MAAKKRRRKKASKTTTVTKTVVHRKKRRKKASKLGTLSHGYTSGGLKLKLGNIINSLESIKKEI